MVKNKVQLITYPDSLGGNLKALKSNLDTYFPNLFEGGIHILPPYPSSGDRGFAPLTYFEIDPQFGDWEDVRNLAEDYDILLDIMVNHISQKSPYCQDFLKNGRDSQYADYFLTLEKIWEDGVPVQSDIDQMFLRRKVPYSEFIIEKTSEVEKFWTTFGKTTPSEQIDLDVHSEQVKQLFVDIFKHFHDNGVKIIRLDAVGYVLKKIGTSCFFVEPDIYDFLDWILGVAKSYDIALLPEVHAHYSIQYKLAEHGCWIYDFILPYRIFEALSNEESKFLVDYLQTRPHGQFTMLDCHDGLPVKPDLDGLIDSKDARKLVDLALNRGANLSLIVSDEHKDEMRMALMFIKFAQQYILSLMKMMILILLHALYKSLHQVFHKSTTLVYLQVRTILKQLKHEVMVVKSTVIILMKKKSRQRQKLKCFNV